MTAFVVMGSAGEYDTHSSWPVKILMGTEKQAAEFVDKCRAQARAVWQLRVDLETSFWEDMTSEELMVVDPTDPQWNATELDPESINYLNEPADYHEFVVEVVSL